MRAAPARALAIDLRSLAAFRTGLGLLLLADLVLRGCELRDHYTEAGALPAELAARVAGPWRWTLHALLPGPAWPAFLMVLAGLAAGALALGLRPRWAAAVGWVLLVSLHHRNHLVLDGADDLLRVTLFWALFVPLPARGAPLGGEHRSVGGACLLLQPVLLYLFTALHKSGPEWWEQGDAVALALCYGQLTRPLAGVLAGVPGLSTLLTRGVLGTEYLAPVLLLAPGWKTRSLGLALLTGLQLGFWACLAIPFFAPAATVALLPFVPGEVWDRLGWRVEPVAGEEPAGSGLLPAAAFAWVVAANLAGLPAVGVEAPEAFAAPGQVLGLEQAWKMFSPGPPDKDGYYLFRGRERGGPWVDLATGEPPREPASHRDAGLPSYRWWKRLEPFQREPWMAEPVLRAAMRAARSRGVRFERAELVFMAFNLRLPAEKRRASPRVLVALEAGGGG